MRYSAEFDITTAVEQALDSDLNTELFSSFKALLSGL